MAVSSNYAQPVQVNGFTCRNCTDVDNAKQHIDPQHPKSGPFDVDAATDPSRQGGPKVEAARIAVRAADPLATPRGAGTLLDTSA
ncbi:MAG: hypothetical protein INR64_16575 [Caulobacteraceae bacterium]|nr:hypothetical protein [Caulobacter sp.]